MQHTHNAAAARPLWEIAQEIADDWQPLGYAAAPYVQAMGRLNSIHDRYGFDDAGSIVRYFLCNCGSWRGDVARRVKAELRALVGIR